MRLIAVAALVLVVLLALAVILIVRARGRRLWREAELNARWEPDAHGVDDISDLTYVDVVLVSQRGTQRRELDRVRVTEVNVPLGDPLQARRMTEALTQAQVLAATRNARREWARTDRRGETG